MALGKLTHRPASTESEQPTLLHELRLGCGIDIAFRSPEKTVNQRSVMSAELLMDLSVESLAMLSKAI